MLVLSLWLFSLVPSDGAGCCVLSCPKERPLCLGTAGGLSGELNPARSLGERLDPQSLGMAAAQAHTVTRPVRDPAPGASG